MASHNGVCLQKVIVVTLPVAEMPEGQFQYLRLLVPEAYDYILSNAADMKKNEHRWTYARMNQRI
jgi:hypothetical protein